ncbi:MAG TPA: hypothetical protein VGN16_21115 [Acidobacteriaceae bacterium]
MIGTLLGRTEHDETVEQSAKSSLRAEIAKRVALGGGWSMGAAIVYGAYSLLHNNPREAFPLLISWGPRAIFAMIALFVVYDLAKFFLNIVKRGVIAMEHTAVALQRVGDKDDRQAQETRTLTAYTSQQSERQGEVLKHVVDVLKKIEAKIDVLQAAGGGGTR